ncbi:MAG: hypothetical protein U1F05_16110 [Burkholderiales bacterium]
MKMSPRVGWSPKLRCWLRAFVLVLAELQVCSGWATPGDLDKAFAPNGFFEWNLGTSSSGVLAIANAGGWNYAFSSCEVGGVRRICIERWIDPRTRDTTFGDNGVALAPLIRGQYGGSEALVTTAGIVLVTSCETGTGQMFICLTRFDPMSGNVDTTFGVGGTSPFDASLAGTFFAGGSAEMASNDILVNVQCFSCTQGAVRKWNAPGQFDASFANTVLLGGALARATPTHYLQAGWCHPQSSVGYSFELCIGRFSLSSASLDLGFGVNGFQYTKVYGNGLATTSAKRLLDGSTLFGVGDASVISVVKLDNAGIPITAFGVNGVATGGAGGAGHVRSLDVDRSGRILAFATCEGITGNSYFAKWCLRRWMSNGATDVDFGANGFSLAFPVWVNGSVDSNHQRAGAMRLDQFDRPSLFGQCLDSAQTTQWNACMARLRGGPYDPMTCSLNGDANGALAAVSDGQMIARYLLGLRGTALTNGAVGPNPGRSNAEIESYLADLLAQGKLDADGDGQSLAMTDGLLILRAMLGLTGDALTAGAVNTAHPNARNAQQILTWIESTHGVACLP